MLRLRVTLNNEEQPEKLPLVVGEVQVDLPEEVSRIIAKSTRIASLVMDAAKRIKEELEHGRS